MQAQRVPTPAPLLEARGIRRVFRSRSLLGSSRSVVAAEDVFFSIDRGETVALVGESGSGKSTLARILLRLERCDGGQILFDGDDVLAREPKGASLAYRRRIQMVFQDPFGSLNPVHDVAHHLIRPLLRHARVRPAEARSRAIELLRTVELQPAEEFIGRRPYELSGGQRQRVAIARALAVEPDLLVADEPTSMLDVSIRMGILNLLIRLKTERRLGILLITHDLASARYLSDRVLVLFRGRVVETGPSNTIVESPAHPYTRALIAAIAEADRTTSTTGAAELNVGGKDRRGRAARGAQTGTGCPFASRCPDVLEACLVEDPVARQAGGSIVRCHLYPPTAPAAGN